MAEAGPYETTPHSGMKKEVRRFCRAPHVQQAEQAGSIILFDGKQYYTLPNEPASELWAFLAEPCSAEELVGRLYEGFDAPREVIAKDVAAQLAFMRRQGLVREVRADGELLAELRPWWELWKIQS